MKDFFKTKTGLDWIFISTILLTILLFGAWLLNEGKEMPAVTKVFSKPIVATIPHESLDQGVSPLVTKASDPPAELDPVFAAALAAAEQIPDPELRRAALAKACYVEAGHDPASAVAAADCYALGDGPGAVLENLAQQWASRDLRAASAWVGAQPAGPERDAVVGRIAFIWSRSEPENAAKWLLQETEAGPQQQEAVMSIIHQWGLKDLSGAADWVAQFPAGNFRSRAMDELQGIADRQSSE